MTYPEQTPDLVGRLGAELARMRDRLAALESRGLIIPVLDNDPAGDDPTNLWLLNDGRLRARDAEGRIREWVPTVDQRPQIPTFAVNPAISTGWRIWVDGSNGDLKARLANDTVQAYQARTSGSSGDGGQGAQGDSGSKDPKPAKSRPHQHRTKWSSPWSTCYCPRHGREGPLHYGRWDATHGERRVMFGLPDANIRNTLAGATIRKVEIRMKNLDAFSFSGVRIHFGAHNNTTSPNSFHQVRRNVWSDHWPHSGGDTWRRAPDWFGEALRDGRIRGLTIDQTSDSRSQYGQAHPDLDIRITYTHKH